MQANQQVMHDRIFYLRRRLKPATRHAGGLLDLAPWVDVVLILILFFMINSATLLKPGVEIQLPVIEVSGGARYDALVITVTGNGTVFFNDERMTDEKLLNVLRERSEKYLDRDVVIEADGRVPFSELANIYNKAVEAGFERVVMASRVEQNEVMKP